MFSDSNPSAAKNPIVLDFDPGEQKSKNSEVLFESPIKANNSLSIVHEIEEDDTSIVYAEDNPFEIAKEEVHDAIDSLNGINPLNSDLALVGVANETS